MPCTEGSGLLPAIPFLAAGHFEGEVVDSGGGSCLRFWFAKPQAMWRAARRI
jgi:hypothetical protein